MLKFHIALDAFGELFVLGRVSFACDGIELLALVNGKPRGFWCEENASGDVETDGGMDGLSGVVDDVAQYHEEVLVVGCCMREILTFSSMIQRAEASPTLPRPPNDRGRHVCVEDIFTHVLKDGHGDLRYHKNSSSHSGHNLKVVGSDFLACRLASPYIE